MKKFILLTVVLSLVVGITAFAKDPAYPTKPITIICPWSAGGGTDNTARFLAGLLSKELGVPVNVVNKTGGNGAVGHMEGAMAAPDGYTITNITFELNTLKYLGYANMTPADIIPIFQFNEDPAALSVQANSPYKNVNDLLNAIKSKPAGTFLFSGSVIACAWDLPRVQMLMAAGIDPKSVKFIPTQGGAAPAITELLGGHVDAVVCSYPEIAPQVEAGKIRTIAVFSDERVPLYPNIPTLKEQGINVSGGTWRGFAVPLKTPEYVIKTLTEAMKKVTASKEFVDFMNKNMFGIKIRDQQEFTAFITDQFKTLEGVMQAAGYLKK